MARSITLQKPDDWHVHFRDHEMLQDTVPATAKHFGRALVMPNLVPPLTTLPSILAYRDRILKHAPADFTPYMTFYLNETVSPETLEAALQYPFILGAKLYPAGVTTHSAQGAQSIKALFPLLEMLASSNRVLQIHGECLEGDIFEREALFIRTELHNIVRNFPKLRIVLEHISTKSAVEFIQDTPSNIAATVTVHHLRYNRNQLLAGGIRPHYYCLPILKHANDQQALLTAVQSGNPKFFAGTDSAPHPVNKKEHACGCAGIYSAPFALAMYANIFDELDALDGLENFCARFGAEFYELPMNSEEITLIDTPQQVPEQLSLGNTQVIPIAAGETLPWSIHESN